MKIAKNQKRPKTGRNTRYAKMRAARTLKAIQHRFRSKSTSDTATPVIARNNEGLRTYYPNHHRYAGVHPYDDKFQKYQWIGLLTLKCYLTSYASDSHKACQNRSKLISDFMENLRARKFVISDREFNWVACHEFGTSGIGHVHAIFSFDHLREKGREKKCKISDFSENGVFESECRESLEFVCRKLGISPSTVDFHWSEAWENTGLVHYLCKIEKAHPEKDVIFSKYWSKYGISLAA